MPLPASDAAPGIEPLAGLAGLAARYDALLCDVWGVIHNGVAVHRAAVEALARWREGGGAVCLLTNSPRRNRGVAEQLAQLGAPRESFDAIVTSGDVTRRLIVEAGETVFHLGPERDRPLFEGLNVRLTALDEAQAIVSTGLFDDETETPDDYRSMLGEAVARGLPFVCANPDIVVERGDRLIWCAGALARLHEELGGTVRMAGKPHAPIYDLAMERLAELRPGLARDRVLAIGDGLPTDVKGANDNGFDLLFIAGGIHAAEYARVGRHDGERLNAFLSGNGAAAAHWAPMLEWGGS